MQYYLKHKNDIIAVIDFTVNAEVQAIFTNKWQYMPIGSGRGLDFFKAWWQDRAVPRTRHGINSVLKALNLPTTQSLLLNNLGLSLTDCYWVCPIQSTLQWEQVNLFTNNFQDSIGELTLDKHTTADIRNKTVFSPGASTQGELRKKWIIDANGNRVLVKGNYGNTYQQSLNEVFITEINRLQNIIPYTVYKPIKLQSDKDANALGCYSLNFCNENVEFFSAWSLLQEVKKPKSKSCYETIFELATQKLGMVEDYVQRFLDYQILLDFVTSNLDRHLNNFGFLRDSNTLQVLGFAPIYDCGNSMFWHKDIVPTGAGLLYLETCSFVKREVKLLRYVKDKNIFDISKLPSETVFDDIYSKENSNYVSRIGAIKQAYIEKIEYLRQFQNGVDLERIRKDGGMY